MPAQIFGLDIGRAFIKVVLVETGANGKVLKAVASMPTPPGGIQSESAVDLQKLSEAIAKCTKDAKIDLDSCAVSLVESQTITRLIQLPNLTDKELASAIKWEAEQYIPLPIKDVSLEYLVVSRPEKNTAGKMDVLLIAAPKRIIEKYTKVVKEAGLKIASLETESTALGRGLTKKDDPATIIVSLGAVSTELVMVASGNVIFTRSIATGGINLTRAIMGEFNLPQAQAEEYKQTYGLTSELSGKVAAVIKPILDVIVIEITKAIDFAHSHLNKQEIARIIITGGGAHLPGLSEYLVEKTSLEVALGDPWVDFVKEGLVLKLPGQGSFYSVATGLALRS